MPRFEVLATEHIHKGEDGKETAFKQGQTVESEKDLDVMFSNKFRRLDEPTRAPMDRDSRLNESGGKQGDRPEHARSTPGNRPADAAAPGSPLKQAGKDADFEEEDDEADGVNGAMDAAGRKFGENVTPIFEDAEEAGLTVFRDPADKTFTVVRTREPGKALNTEELKTKQAAKKFVRDTVTADAAGGDESDGTAADGE